MNRLVLSVLMLLLGPALPGAVPATSPAQEIRRSRAVDQSVQSVTPETPTREITLLHSDNRRLVFEYRPRFFPPRTIRDGSESFTVLPFEGSVALHDAGDIGEPDIRFRSVAIAMPAPEGSVVRVLDAESDELREIAPPPVPFWETEDSLPGPATYTRNREAYARSGFLPSQAVQVEYTGRARSLPLGIVRIFPVQYDLTARTARRYTRMLIEVTFGPAAIGRVERADAVLFKDAVLNSEVVMTWSVPGRAKPAVQPVSSVLASGDWYRLTVNEEGIYRLDGQWFSAAGISIGSVDPRTIKIYGNGGREIPEDVSLPRAEDLSELAIHVEGESDGSFGTGDFVLFYGRSTRTWYYDAQARIIRHTINRYAEENYYWLTFGGTQGRRMTDRPSASAPPDVVADSFVDGVAIEEEKINLLGSGKDWLGQSIAGPSGSFTHVTHLPGLLQGNTITYRYRLVAHSRVTSTYTVREGGTVIETVTIPGIYSYLEGQARVAQASGSSSLPNNESQLSFTYSSSDAGSQGWIDWIEILYPRMLWAESDELRFRSPDVSGVVEYRLQQFGAMPWIFDVTDHDSVQRISGVTGSYTFRATEVFGREAEYCAAGPSAWRVPAGVHRMPNQDLRGYADGADFIILTTPAFEAVAEKLKAHRARPEYGNLNTVIVDVNDVYNEFGGGIPDITAIRDYLKYAYDHWTPRPSYVLFLGGGSYDYKGKLGFSSSFVPNWQSIESLDDVESYTTDDYFVMFGPSTAISLVPGRISARNPAEADAVVDKIIRYDQYSIQDSWKTRMLFLGDDAWTSDNGNAEGSIHSGQAELLASDIYTPDEFEKKKIYLAEYPTENTAVGRRKPGAYADIIDRINEGVLMVNFSGHGNPNVWTHERVFEVGTSIPQLVNRDKLAVFFLATCNFSQYDNPKALTGAEILMNRREGGAVGVISATRKVYSGGNARLHQETFRQMFVRDAFGRVVVKRPATALYLWKVTGGNTVNDQKFFFMGDPTMRLQYPQRHASIDSINGEPVDSVAGSPRQSLIQLKSLSRVTVKGTVRNESNEIDESYSGTLSLIVNDATRQQTIVDFTPGFNWSYLAAGGTIYRGANSVANGRFNATFVVPKDIAHADTTENARLVAYFSDASADGVAYTGKIFVGGTDTTVGADAEGPSITISLENRSFRPGDLVTESPMLYLDFEDSSGINTSGSGIGHRIEAWLNNSTQSLDLTDFYTSNLDDYTRGTVQYKLDGLGQGRNTIVVRAWDSYNNSAIAETFFEVAASNQLVVADVFNYPNPFARETAFTFRHNRTDPITITVKVYTVAGRAIQTLETYSSGETYVRIPWDGRDRDGDLLANGVYLYKLVVKTADGSLGTEALGKMSIIR